MLAPHDQRKAEIGDGGHGQSGQDQAGPKEFGLAADADSQVDHDDPDPVQAVVQNRGGQQQIQHHEEGCLKHCQHVIEGVRSQLDGGNDPDVQEQVEHQAQARDPLQ